MSAVSPLGFDIANCDIKEIEIAATATNGAREDPEVENVLDYLFRFSSLSGGRATSRPSIGKALSSMLKPMPSL